ncbi:GNAT family N-acetyltransferase [uncultured Roseivirga sp.]|uniref:GNAT family N-acetyltransferase n=1 Tax=uncultured Roseivirga sp. TaxID=543088 RepID=UPI0030DBD6A7|tara:strand:- start:130397 stop:130870 length:474 start_codon:yes stop_codon:yes gene_type:complete
MDIEFKLLGEVQKSDIIDLMNNQLVRRQMPLLTGKFDENTCSKFIEAKETLWQNHGYGPWAFIVKGQFAGWGGLQMENGEADMALVLHPNYWGIGKLLFKKVINKAFGEMGLTSITVLFPPTRTRIQGILRLGFIKEGKHQVGNEEFIRYRLNKPVK